MMEIDSPMSVATAAVATPSTATGTPAAAASASSRITDADGATATPQSTTASGGAGTDEGSLLADVDLGAADEEVPVHVEVCLKLDSTAKTADIRTAVQMLLESSSAAFINGAVDFSSSALLVQHVHSVHVCDIGGSRARGPVSFWQAALHIHVYQLSQDGVSEEFTDAAEGGESVAACSQWVLPAIEFHGLWDTLVYEPGIKNRLLEYATSAMLFADAHVDTNIISLNRVVLLHGPPGTGKTSLCRGLAQKLAVRFMDRYASAQLLEINAHSLFSKWFSESGKLVMKLFSHIHELVDDEESLVCVLIDEVESLTAARQAAVSGSEPSDAVRVVNALLTQIDSLRHRENVLVLTTSNITEAIDLAFVDRADIKQFIGLPGMRARYEILRSCVDELMRKGIVAPPVALEDRSGPHDAKGASGGSTSTPSSRKRSKPQSSRSKAQSSAASGASASSGKQSTPSQLLEVAAARAQGLSGRALRKLPFQAHAFFVQAPTTTPAKFMRALIKAATAEHSNRSDMKVEGAASGGGAAGGSGAGGGAGAGAGAGGDSLKNRSSFGGGGGGGHHRK